MHLNSYFSLEISYGHAPFTLHFNVMLELAPTKVSFTSWEQALLPKIKLLTQEFWAATRTQWSNPVFTGFMSKIKNWFYWVAQNMVTNAVYTQLDNINHSFERFFPSIHLHKQLHNCYIASEAFAWRAGKEFHLAVALRFSHLDLRPARNKPAIPLSAMHIWHFWKLKLGAGGHWSLAGNGRDGRVKHAIL